MIPSKSSSTRDPSSFTVKISTTTELNILKESTTQSIESKQQWSTIVLKQKSACKEVWRVATFAGSHGKRQQDVPSQIKGQ